MKKIVAVIFVIIALFFGFLLLKPSSAPNISTPAPSSITEETKVNVKASFVIITGNITRNFSAEKYHNQSSVVYIESSDPTIVNVTKPGITWDDFFKTLPMKLTKECLITGDGETLCDGKNGTLEFYLNDIETPDLLDKEIRDKDKALIIFI